MSPPLCPRYSIADRAARLWKDVRCKAGGAIAIASVIGAITFVIQITGHGSIVPPPTNKKPSPAGLLPFTITNAFIFDAQMDFKRVQVAAPATAAAAPCCRPADGDERNYPQQYCWTCEIDAAGKCVGPGDFPPGEKSRPQWCEFANCAVGTAEDCGGTQRMDALQGAAKRSPLTKLKAAATKARAVRALAGASATEVERYVLTTAG